MGSRAPNYLDMMGTTIGTTKGWNYLYISNYDLPG